MLRVSVATFLKHIINMNLGILSDKKLKLVNTCKKEYVVEGKCKALK